MDSRKILEIYKLINDRSIKPVNAWPSIADIPQGALVLDSDGVVKQKRFVVELNGPDTLTFQPPASDLKSINWEFSICFRDVNSSQNTFSRIIQFMASSLANLIIVANITGGLEFYLRNDGSNNAHLFRMDSTYNDLEYHKLTFGVYAGVFYAFSEKEPKKTITIQNWNGTGFTSVLISDTQISIRPLQVSTIKQATSEIVDCFACDEQSGTVIANACMPSRPATLSDADAHVGTLVPVSLL